MLTSEQIRAGRALLRLDQAVLAEVSGLSVPTIKRLEQATGPISANTSSQAALEKAFTQAGVVFVTDNGQGSGVRFRRPQHAERAKERIDEAFDQLEAEGVQIKDVQLCLMDSAVLQRVLGLEAPPKTYRGTPVSVDARAGYSAIRAAHPNQPGRLHRLF